jgi:hypothetical protein
VAAPDCHVRHPVHARLVGQHALVFGIHGQALAAACDKVERPLPFFIAQVAVRPGAAHFGQQLGRLEAAAQRHRHQMLHQHVERFVGHQPRFDAATDHCLFRARRFEQFQAVGRYQRDARDASWRVTAATGPLQQAGDPFCAADLQDPLDWQKIDPQIKARGADDCLQRTLLQAHLDPVAYFAVERAMVERNQTGPIGPRFEDVLVPQLGLRAGVGEHQRRVVGLDFVDHGQQHLDAEMAAPRKARDIGGNERVDPDLLA